MVDQAYQVISKDLHEFIRTKHSKVVTFYSLPKIHKDLKKNLWTAYSFWSISKNLSRVIDAYLQPYVLSMPSFFKDTIHFLKVIEELTISDDSILVAIDVEALDDEDLVEYTSHKSTWLRYIDDVFWEGTTNNLMEFFDIINTNVHNLKFTMSHDCNTITLLDVQIKRDSEGKLHNTLFHKSTVGNTVLHADSFHPVPLKNSIPYGQYLRLCRNCSTDALFNEEATKLQIRLMERGYSRSCLRKAYNQTSAKTHFELLFKQKPKKNSDLDTTRVVMRYSKQHEEMQKIVQKHWTILTDDPRVNPFVTILCPE